MNNEGVITNILPRWLIIVFTRKGTWATNKSAWLAFTMNGTNHFKDKLNVRHNQHAQGMAQVAPEDELEGKQDQLTPIKAPMTIGQKFVGLIN